MDMLIFVVEDEVGMGIDICVIYCVVFDCGCGVFDVVCLKVVLNVYFDFIVIYDDDLWLVFCNDGYVEFMFDNFEDFVLGMYLEDVFWLVIVVGWYFVVVG